MPVFTWNDNYSVKNEMIDSHHKILVGMINQLHEAMSVGKGNQELGAILDRLVDYTVFHFSAEEKLMAQYGYPESASHQDKHAKLIGDVGEFQGKFRKGQLGLSVQMINFLKDWLSNHILGDDKKFGAYLQQKGLS